MTRLPRLPSASTTAIVASEDGNPVSEVHEFLDLGAIAFPRLEPVEQGAPQSLDAPVGGPLDIASHDQDLKVRLEQWGGCLSGGARDLVVPEHVHHVSLRLTHPHDLDLFLGHGASISERSRRKPAAKAPF